jgi:inosine/xanthosine triphosphate pyrophosphatase family protein
MQSLHTASSHSYRLRLCAGNANKARELAEFFASNPVPFNITPTSLDLPEIQGDPEEIAMYKCSTAMEKLQAPVLVEDVCLGFNALHGLPGPGGGAGTAVTVDFPSKEIRASLR